MTQEGTNMFNTKMFNGSESNFHTRDGFRVHLDIKRLHEVLSSDNDLPILVLVSGTSESGKSHLGKKFVSDGLGHRFKIYKTISELIHSSPDLTQETDAVEFSTKAESLPKERLIVVDHIVNEYVSSMRDSNVLVGIVETLKHPWLVDDLKSRQDIRVISMYVDGPIDARVSRQAEKTGKSIAEVKAETLAKDEYKMVTGTKEIEYISDIVVWNGGSVETYDNFIEILETTFKKNTKGYSGSASDFS